MKKSVIRSSLIFLFLISFCTVIAETNEESKIVNETPIYINMDDYDKRTVIIKEGTLVIIKKDKSKVTTKLKVNLENVNINDKELNIGESISSKGINYKLEKIENGFAYIILTSVKEEVVEEVVEEILEEEVEEIIAPEEEDVVVSSIGAFIGTAKETVKSLWIQIIGGIIILFIIIYLLYIIVFRSGAPLQLKRDYNWYYNRASLLHRKGEQYYKKKKKEKAEKFYKKAQSYRETGEQKR